MFPLIITYYTSLRGLKEQYTNCTLTNSQSMISYICEVQAQTSNIKQIKSESNFNFLSQNNVNLIGITPLAKMFINNIQNIEDKYDILLNPNQTIFIIDNTTLNRNGTHQFTISGMMITNKPKTDLKNKDLILITNIESDGDEVQKELNCTIIDITDNKYTLTCLMKENVEHDLQSAVSIIDEGIILINFDMKVHGNESTLYPQTETKVSNKYHYNKSKGLNAGSVIAIILPLLAAVVAVGSIIVCLGNKSKELNHIEYNQSSIHNLKNMN